MNPSIQEPPEAEKEAVEDILRTCSRIAVVGISPKPERDSHRVAAYLLEQGYEIIPVNPAQGEILGKTCYKSLTEIPFAVDMADLFLNPKRVPPLVDQAIELAIPVIWMQLGVVHAAAAAKARRAGIRVVTNMCVMQEHKRLAKSGLQ